MLLFILKNVRSDDDTIGPKREIEKSVLEGLLLIREP